MLTEHCKRPILNARLRIESDLLLEFFENYPQVSSLPIANPVKNANPADIPGLKLKVTKIWVFKGFRP
jgi:hypothetical protein